MIQRTRGPEHDVLVVGGGPAGSQLALRLAHAGRSVVLVEARHFPRAKPCGEFMSPACLPLLDELGLRVPLADLGARRVRGMAVHGYGHQASARYGDAARASAAFDHGYAVRREVLDTRLLLEARRHPDVEVLEGWRVRRLLRAADGRVEGAEVTHPEGGARLLRARCTVGADGRQSVVARELGARSFDPGLRRHALVARFRGVAPLDQGEVHLFPGGYFAAAPVDGGLFTLNLVLPELPAGRQALEDCLERHVRLAPALEQRLTGSTREGDLVACGPLAVRTRTRTFEGAALLGDAAGFVDPLTGEGLFLAMLGARLLAPVLDHALRVGRPTRQDLAAYERAWKREVAPRHRVARWLQAGIQRPGLTRGALGLMEAWPGLTSLVVDLTGDHLSPGQLLDPRLWWRAAATGWRPAALAASASGSPE